MRRDEFLSELRRALGRMPEQEKREVLYDYDEHFRAAEAQFVGWLGNLAGGVDVSLLAALVLPAILYPVCLFIFPEPRGVFGPQGPRFVPSAARPVAPVVGERRIPRGVSYL